MSFLRPFLAPHRGRLVLAVGLACVAALLELLPHGIVYLAAVDVFASPPRHDRLVGLAALAMGGVVLRFVCTGASLVLTHAVAFDVLRRLRDTLVQRLARADRAALGAHSPGSLKKALVEDIDGVEGLIAHHLPDFVSAVVVPLVAFGLLLWVDWRLALASVALVPVAAGLMTVFMSNMDGDFRAWHGAEARANGAILEYLRGIAVLKAHDADASSLARVRGSIQGLARLAESMTRRTSTGFTAFRAALQNNLVVILPVGVWMHQQGRIDTPTLVLFVLLGFGLTAPLLKLLFLFGNLQMAQVRLQRLEVLLGLPLQPERPPKGPVRGPQPVVVRDLGFTYDPERGPVLQGIDFEARPDQVTAIVGPSGSGKSTLLHLVRGRDLPTPGP